MSHQPEKLNLWDRLFNRYRREVADRGIANRQYIWWDGRPPTQFTRPWIEYRVIDRLTGSETIEREYLS